jgi:hypothetical protein
MIMRKPGIMNYGDSEQGPDFPEFTLFENQI